MRPSQHFQTPNSDGNWVASSPWASTQEREIVRGRVSAGPEVLASRGSERHAEAVASGWRGPSQNLGGCGARAHVTRAQATTANSTLSK